jgi:hypothetical protein
MPRLINWELISNPFNWLAIFIMLAAACLFWTAVYNSLYPFNESATGR